MANSADLIAVMAELHAALAPGDLAQTLRRVTDAAVELLPDVDGASITVEHEDGLFETAAATGSVDAGPEPTGNLSTGGPDMAADTAVRLDRVQQALGEGPAVDVASPSGSMRATEATRPGPEESGVPSAGRSDADGLGVREPTEPGDGLMDAHPGDVPEPGQAPAVRISDMSRDDRYPEYGAVAMGAGVRAQVAVVLFDTDRARGVLNLYSLRHGAFDDTAVLTDLFAHHSATALAYAAEYHARETTGAERHAIGQALGIVMERYTLSESDAYALMQQTAERRAVSVRLVAQELVARAEGAGSHE